MILTHCPFRTSDVNLPGWNKMQSFCFLGNDVQQTLPVAGRDDVTHLLSVSPLHSAPPVQVTGDIAVTPQGGVASTRGAERIATSDL